MADAKVASKVLPRQGYCVVTSSQRLAVLCCFLNSIIHRKKKVVVFFTTCNAVEFHSALLRCIFKVDDGYYFYDIHGMQKQSVRTDTFRNFWKADKGILLWTDPAARGLELPDVDWIVQYDPPAANGPKEYINRASEALHGSTKSCEIILFLTPEELQFCKYLKAMKVRFMEFVFKDRKLENMQSDLENLVASNDSLKKLARAAYKSYVLAYKWNPMKKIFNVKKLDSKAVAASFCLSSSPVIESINVNVEEITRSMAEQTIQEEPTCSKIITNTNSDLV